MELFLNILYIYVAIYSVFFLVAAIKNLNDKKFRIQKKYNINAPENKLCVVIYSHNNASRLVNLIKQLKEQDYPQSNFSTFVILDNCSDNSEKIFYQDDFAQVLNINGQGTIGKDQSISILLENLSTIQKSFNAFVFIDAKRYIDKDFLSNVNAALEYSPVISGATTLIGENLTFVEKIKLNYHKYYTNFMQKSRSLMGLATIIDSDIFIIKRSLMEKIGCVDFQNINCELKYSLMLSKIGCKCVFNPNIKTYINIEDFKLRIPSLSSRLNLFKNCITQIWNFNFIFTEHVLSLITPNIILILLAYTYLLNNAYNYYFMVDFSVVLVTFVLLALGFSISLLNANLHSKDYIYLFLYPVYSIGHIFKNLPLFRKIRSMISKKNELIENTEKLIVDVAVTDGKNHIPCKLELRSENGLAKVVFIFKNKKFTTKTHLRMVDAISELINKLSDYGFVLQICQSCASFTPNIDGSTNMVKGFCKHRFSNIDSTQEMPTLLWNSCKGFNQNQSNNVIEEIFK